jgi:Flp pilus assembly protein TadG
MRATAPSTKRRADIRRRAQQGQAIVLIALMMLVLLGMVGIAIDGGRGYVDRRELQDAADAAALAAGDNYLNTVDQTKAELAASYQFAANMRITGAESNTGLGSDTETVSWGGYPGSYRMQVTHNAFNGTNFLVTVSHKLTLSFMQALGIPPIITTATAAKAVVMSQAQTPALLTLSTSCANGSNASLFMNGSANVAIIGAMYANGSVDASGGIAVTVAGNAFDGQCVPAGGTIPNVTLYCYDGQTNPPSSYAPNNGVCPIVNGYQTVLGQMYTGAPPLPDPAYVAPPVTGLPPRSSPGTNVLMLPGNYGQDPNFTGGAGCYFLAPGVYEWSAGYTQNGGFVSNELRPPDEARAGSLTNRADPQLWKGTGTNVVNCDGSFEVGGVTSHAGGGQPLPSGNWGVFITSVRTDTYNGTTYYRESAPSMCRQVNLDGRVKGFQLAISNVPGAQSYNIYASPTGCGGPFGYIDNVPNQVVESNSSTGSCPALPPMADPIAPVTTPYTPVSGTVNGCSLGYVVSNIEDKSNINTPYTVNSSYCPITGPNGQWCQYPFGSPSSPGPNDGGLQPPASGGLPQESPLADIGTNGGGDRANEHQCRPQTSPTVASPCLGSTVTPGAVQFYFPPSQCLAIQGSGSTFGDLFIFGGRQYLGIVLYAPPSNTCSLMKLAGGSQTSLIGTTYMPGATFDVTGHAHSAVVGQVIVNQAKVDGTTGTAITYDPDLAPPAPGAKLIL